MGSQKRRGDDDINLRYEERKTDRVQGPYYLHCCIARLSLDQLQTSTGTDRLLLGDL